MLRSRSVRVVFSLASVNALSLFGLLTFGLLTTTAPAQRSPNLNDPVAPKDSSTSYNTAPGTGVLIFSVFAENSSTHLDRQALLKLVNLEAQTATWQTTEDTSRSIFANVPYGSYEVEVSAVGYLSAHKELQVMNSLRPLETEIVLHRDPSAVNLDVAAGVTSPKVRRQTKRAIAALKSGDLEDAQRQLNDAFKTVPSSPDLNFLLGYLYFQKKDYAQAENYLNTAAALKTNNVQTLTLLGRAALEQQNYPAARSALELAIIADPDSWLPHDLLANAYLRQQDYGKARDEAQAAIDKGKAAASPAQLVLGQALIGLGRRQEGVQALNTFLQDSPRHPMAGQVRNLISEIKVTETKTAETKTTEIKTAEIKLAELKERDSASAPPPARAEASSGEANAEVNSVENAAVKTETTTEAEAGTKLLGLDPLLALPGPGLFLTSWQPAGVDEMKPALAGGVTCPSERVIQQSGKGVQELVEDVTRFAAVEDLLHQRVDAFGTPTRTETRKFNYIATISESEPGFLSVDEDRSDRGPYLGGSPDQIASTGFVALALVFHPDMRDNFEISCEGLGGWRGQATWVLYFRQRDDRPARMHSYKVGDKEYPVKLKGRAWVTADKFQIVRIESEMVTPMPEIQLLSEHQVVEYGPIPFPRKHTSLWLPKSAEIYFDFRKRHYYRRHSFDRYMLFSVDTEEKDKPPDVGPPSGR